MEDLTFTHNDLIAYQVLFGEYLLSVERENSIRENPDFRSGELVEERLRTVHQSDLDNFNEMLKIS